MWRVFLGTLSFQWLIRKTELAKCTQGLEEEATVTSITDATSASKVIPVHRGHSHRRTALEATGFGLYTLPLVSHHSHN